MYTRYMGLIELFGVVLTLMYHILSALFVTQVEFSYQNVMGVVRITEVLLKPQTIVTSTYPPQA